MKKSKKNKKNEKNKSIIVLILAVLVLCIITIFLLISRSSKNQNLSLEKEPEGSIISESIDSYEVYIDESGNEIRRYAGTDETTIITKDMMPTFSSEQQEKYESQSQEKQFLYDIKISKLDKSLENGDITESEYNEKVEEAMDENVINFEALIDHNEHILRVSKEIFENCDKDRFMQRMALLYDDYNAVVNLDNDSYDNPESKEIILYVSDFVDKDYEDIKNKFIEAFGNEDFTFKKEK